MKELRLVEQVSVEEDLRRESVSFTLPGTFFCDGQSLASPGRWAPEDRIYPESERWLKVVSLFRRYADTYTSARFLVELSLGRIVKCPFDPQSIGELKSEIVELAKSYGLELLRVEGDRVDVPIDFRFMDLVLRLADDPEKALGSYAQGSSRSWRPHAETTGSLQTEKTLAPPGADEPILLLG